jgi:hypothetical protein
LHLGHSYVTPPLLLCTSFSCRLHEAGSPNALGQYSHVYGLSPVLQIACEHHWIKPTQRGTYWVFWCILSCEGWLKVLPHSGCLQVCRPLYGDWLRLREVE